MPGAGLLAMVFSSFLFSFMALLVKFLKDEPTFELVFWRSVFMTVFSMSMLLARGVPPFGLPGQRVLLTLRGIAGFGFMGGYYYAIKIMPLSDAVVITYTSPVITAVVAAVLLKEGLEKVDVLGSVLCMTGVVLTSKPGFVMEFFGMPAESLPAVGVFAAVLAALFSTSVYVLLRYGKDLHPMVSVNYFAIAGVFISPVFGWIFQESWIVPQGVEWLQLFLLAGLSVVGQAMMNIGLALESAGKATAMNYVQVVFAYIFQIYLLHKSTDLLSVIGASLIASWGIIALVKDARKKKQAEPLLNVADKVESDAHPAFAPEAAKKRVKRRRSSVEIAMDGAMEEHEMVRRASLSFTA